MYEVRFKIARRKEESFCEELFSRGADSVSVTGTDAPGDCFIQAIVRETEMLGGLIDMAVSVAAIEEESWKYRWLQDFNGFEVNGDIYIHPVTASRPPDRNYPYLIRIDPRDAFGDGRHPTTAMCLRLLHRIAGTRTAEERSRTSLLDIGTGTGVIPILSRMMGIGPIEAIDIEEASITMAGRNFELNRVDIVPRLCDIAVYSPGRRFDIITANLLSSILQEHISRIKELLSPAGVIIASGVSGMWEQEMRNCFLGAGLKTVEAYALEDWRAFLLQKIRNVKYHSIPDIL